MQTPASPAAKSSVYLIAAHDNWRSSRINRRLYERALSLPHVQTCDLYGTYPDYCIDVPLEQSRLMAAQLVVLLHPIHWYSMPALQKLWLDDVLTEGWAYGSAHNLKGKDFWLVTSTGGPSETYQTDGYNRYPFDAFLPPYEQTASLCGMRFLPPLILHGSNQVTDDQLALHVDAFAHRLAPVLSVPGLATETPALPTSGSPVMTAESR